MASTDPRTEFQSPREALAEFHRLPEPRTAAEVRDRLNLIERALTLIDPHDDFEAEILDALNALISLERTGSLPGAPPEDGETPMEVLIGSQGERAPEVLGLLDEIAELLDQTVQGVTDTTNLPAGLTGRAANRIENDASGVAVFELSGGEFAAEVQASETILPQQRIRVLPQGRNLVAPVEVTGSADTSTPIERRRVEPGTTVQQNTDIFSNDIEPTAEGSEFIITVGFANNADLDVVFKPEEDDISNQSLQLNQGGTLTGGAQFTFDGIQVSRGDAINFQVTNADRDVRYFIVNEGFE